MKLPTWCEGWFNSNHRYKIAYGGRGAGAKSESIARMLILKIIHNQAMGGQPMRILCAREFRESTVQSVYTTLRSIIQNDPALAPHFRIMKTCILSHYGDEIFFRGLKVNIGGVRSTAYIDIAWVEEAQYVSQQSWQDLMPTVRKPGSQIWISMNRRFLTDPTDFMFIQNDSEDYYKVKLTQADNPWFNETEMPRDMKRDYATNPDLAKHVWGGEPLQYSDAQVLHGKWVVKEFTPGPDWDGPYYGVDWGVVDPTAAVKVWLHQDCLYVEHEVYGRTDEVIELLKGLPGLAKHTSRADSAWPETIRSAQRGGFPRLTAVVKWPGSEEEGIRWLRSRKQIIIHPRCRNAQLEAGLWRRKTDNGGNVLPTLQPGNDHLWDAVRYACVQHIRKRAPATVTNW